MTVSGRDIVSVLRDGRTNADDLDLALADIPGSWPA